MIPLFKVFMSPDVLGLLGAVLTSGYIGQGPKVEDIRYWLDRPVERERIARVGQELVLGRFTYRRAVQELCHVIEETL